jgi:hypothetical protein
MVVPVMFLCSGRSRESLKHPDAPHKFPAKALQGLMQFPVKRIMNLY